MFMTKPKFYKFNELDINKINFDFHFHTDQTDGIDTIEAILYKAKEYKIDRIAFTEHVRKDTAWFDSFVDRVKNSAEQFPEITVYIGCETKAIDNKGTLDISDNILHKSDIVLGSVHRLPNYKDGYLDFSKLSSVNLAEIEYEMSMGMLENAPIDVLAHHGGMHSSRYEGYPALFFREMMKMANKKNKAIEINSRYLKNTYDFFDVCAEINPFISIGSDAHKAEDIGGGIRLMNLFKPKKLTKKD